MRLFEFASRYTGPLVYHGTKDDNLSVLEPRQSNLVGEPVVFAASLMDVAIAMAGHWTDEDFEFGRTGQEHDGEMIRYTMRELRAGAFEKFFNEPLTIYLLPARGFKPHEKLQDFELAATHAVEPVSFIHIVDPLDHLRNSPVVQIKTI